jgi:hypothetical protein
MPMTPQQEEAQISGGDNPYHWHAHDRVVNHDTLTQLNQIANQRSITTSTYTVQPSDDYLLVGTTSTITLPAAKNGQEYEIVKVFSGGYIIILPAGTDTVVGTTSVLVTVQWTALRFKAVSGGWILI